ncbi:MAG: hypothetical protein J6386_12515 [Candidatus Synoicihabitans palmerolidicus]|nr:hypothetical protein [Candidatus Synoicihabitans palmerolidicus]
MSHNPWVRGFLTNVLNPKATLFFFALFTTAVDPATPRWVELGYGVWMAVAATAWFTFVGLVFTQAKVMTVFMVFAVALVWS